MKIIGIICEYNPFHLGHQGHIEKTIKMFGEDECAIIGVMSGNYVQRGDLAIFNKHARAEAAVRCGADLIIELPTPFALSSAEGFARAGVHILDSTGVCEYISFGSEAGSIEPLHKVANALNSDEADILTKKWLITGLPYAAARQKAADEILGAGSAILASPNNLLGIEYIIALSAINSTITPVTVSRTGGMHDGDSPYAASTLRKMLTGGEEPWAFMPDYAADVYKKEISLGRGPVSIKHCESAILSRLRIYESYDELFGASEGLEHRIIKHAKKESTIDAILRKTKTKRYVMSRLRRMMLCASLNITKDDVKNPPPYIRVLAMNKTGMRILKDMRKRSKLPIITKPASVHKLDSFAANMFFKEVAATDLYTLAFSNENERIGGGEWLESPRIINQTYRYHADVDVRR